MIAPRADVVRIARAHRKAIWRQWTTEDKLVWGGVALVLGCPLIGLAIGLLWNAWLWCWCAL